MYTHRGYDHVSPGIYVHPYTGNEIHKLPHPFKKAVFIWAAKYVDDPEVLLFEEFRRADEYLTCRRRYERARNYSINIPPIEVGSWKSAETVSKDDTSTVPPNSSTT